MNKLLNISKKCCMFILKPFQMKVNLKYILFIQEPTLTSYKIHFVLLEIVLVLVTTEPPDNEEDSRFLLQYLLRRVATHDQEIKDNVFISINPIIHNNQENNYKNPDFDTDLSIVVSRSHQVLHLLMNDKNSMNFLWPQILNYIMIPAYCPGLSIILKNLNSFLTKNSENTEIHQQYLASISNNIFLFLNHPYRKETKIIQPLFQIDITLFCAMYFQKSWI